jgi:hypothetical protein
MHQLLLQMAYLSLVGRGWVGGGEQFEGFKGCLTLRGPIELDPFLSQMIKWV